MEQITIIARAKLNMYLHITGRDADGYHDLETLIAFADWGDTIRWQDSPQLAVHIDGPFAHHINQQESVDGPHSHNLLLRAIYAYADTIAVQPRGQWHLTKSIPAGGGLGGGSADAAAALRVMEMIHGIPLGAEQAKRLCRSLGADVWMCYHGQAGFYGGRGDCFRHAVKIPAQSALILYPGSASATPQVYAAYRAGGGGHAFHLPGTRFPRRFNSPARFRAFVADRGNDLAAPSLAINPAMQAVHMYAARLVDTSSQAGVMRVTGSGSCLFLLADAAALVAYKTLIENENPTTRVWLVGIG